MLKKIIVSLILFAWCTAFPAGAAAADDPAEPGKWQFAAEIYAFLPSIKGEAANGSDFDIGLGSIIDNLNFTFMGIVGAQKDKWTFTTDLIYLNMGDDESGTVPKEIDGHIVPVQVYADVEMKSWIITPAVSYNILNQDGFRLDVMAGARYFYIDVDAKLNVGPASRRASESDSVWDAIVGVRGRMTLNDKWYLPYSFDIGTGQSDLTYQLYGGVGYRFTKVDLVAGYRYLRWNLDDHSVLDDVDISGPMVGVKFRF